MTPVAFNALPKDNIEGARPPRCTKQTRIAVRRVTRRAPSKGSPHILNVLRSVPYQEVQIPELANRGRALRKLHLIRVINIANRMIRPLKRMAFLRTIVWYPDILTFGLLLLQPSIVNRYQFYQQRISIPKQVCRMVRPRMLHDAAQVIATDYPSNNQPYFGQCETASVRQPWQH